MKDEKWSAHFSSCLKNNKIEFAIFKEEKALILLKKRLSRKYFYLTHSYF